MKKDGIGQIVGKTIKSVILSEDNRKNPPLNQIFLVFADGTYFEIYGEFFTGGTGLHPGGEEAAVKYAKMFDGKITKFSVTESSVK